MTKKIQRTTDNKFLLSISDDTWVSDLNEAYIMTPTEYSTITKELLNTYTKEQLKEYINMYAIKK